MLSKLIFLSQFLLADATTYKARVSTVDPTRKNGKFMSRFREKDFNLGEIEWEESGYGNLSYTNVLKKFVMETMKLDGLLDEDDLLVFIGICDLLKPTPFKHSFILLVNNKGESWLTEFASDTGINNLNLAGSALSFDFDLHWIPAILKPTGHEHTGDSGNPIARHIQNKLESYSKTVSKFYDFKEDHAYHPLTHNCTHYAWVFVDEMFQDDYTLEVLSISAEGVISRTNEGHGEEKKGNIKIQAVNFAENVRYLNSSVIAFIVILVAAMVLAVTLPIHTGSDESRGDLHRLIRYVILPTIFLPALVFCAVDNAHHWASEAHSARRRYHLEDLHLEKIQWVKE